MKLTNNTIYYFHKKGCNDQMLFGHRLYEMLRHKWNQTQPLIILCIGTDKVTGDSLGPIVGYRLKTMLSHSLIPSLHDNVHIYGTLKSPVHAVNLVTTLLKIRHDFALANGLKDAFILVVDAALGYEKHLGYVTLSEQPLTPGEGVNKKLPSVGQISITGIIGPTGGSSYRSQLVLKQTKLYDLMKLSDFISDGILAALRLLAEEPDSL